MTPKTKTAFLITTVLLAGCAHLHHVQLADIDNSRGPLTRFDIKQSDTGVNISEAAGIAKAVSHNRSVERASKTVSNIWQLITYGPKTGNVTFSDSYADQMSLELAKTCPQQEITGLMSLRETNKYPVISGEIVRWVGYCMNPAPRSKLKSKANRE